MVQFKKLVIAISILVSASAHAFDATNPPPSAPSGWSPVEKYKNVYIYRKNGENTYVQVVDMTQGGHIRLFQYQGPKEGTNNTYYKNDLNYWWNQLGTDYSSRVSVINGQFFNISKNPTPLSYGLKSGGVVEPGADNNTSLGYNLKMMVLDGYAPYTTNWYEGRLYDNSIQNAIVGLDIRADKGMNEAKGRTSICSKPYYSNYLRQSTNLFLAYVSSNKTQTNANQDLANWGCNELNTVMLDGSNSSKLKTKGGIVIDMSDAGVFYRAIPQAIGIYN